MNRFLEFIKSEKALIAVAFVFIVAIALYNVYDLSADKNERYAYSKEEVQSLSVELVDINKADKETLCTLPGIGESTANEIIKYRRENGSFKSVEEIREVKGIGYQDYLKIAPLITV